jgi:predicted short-subunit dehydrogenase-like oxidoreductase (DUF2520 family)
VTTELKANTTLNLGRTRFPAVCVKESALQLYYKAISTVSSFILTVCEITMLELRLVQSFIYEE